MLLGLVVAGLVLLVLGSKVTKERIDQSNNIYVKGVSFRMAVRAPIVCT